MSTTDPQPGQISQVVFSIVSKGRENKSLSSLTPRLVRSEVENELGLPKNTLDVPKYREIVKRAINDAMQSKQNPGASASKEKKKGETGSARKAVESGRSSLSKSAKSKEVISDSDSAAEPAPSPSRSNVKTSANADEKSKPVRPNSKTKPSKTVSAAAKPSSPDAKAAQSGPKRKRASAPIVQSDSDPEFSDKKRKVSSSSRNKPDDNKSDSEISSLVDEPIKKNRRKSASSDTGKSKAKTTRAKKPAQPLSKEEETIKELKALVRLCGVHKIWSKELNGLDLNSQITQIRKILTDLGMKGRMSTEQAIRIRDRREFAQELDDVQRFGNAIAAGKPFGAQGTSRRVSKRGGNKDGDPDDASDQESESASDHQQPVVVNNARRSIMAFLQDQSSDDD